MTPLYTKVLPEAAANPLLAVSVMPRFRLRLALPEACSAPPDKVMAFAVNAFGAAPKLASDVMAKIPAEMVVAPL